MTKKINLSKAILSFVLISLFCVSLIIFFGCGKENKDGDGGAGNQIFDTNVPSSEPTVVNEYFLVADGNKLVGLTESGKTQSSLTIPSSIQVICIEALRSNSIITKITLPTSIKAIGDGAFYNCPNLKSVYITDLKSYALANTGVLAAPTYNGADLYLNSNKVTSIDFSKMDIPESSFVGGFAGCKSIESVTLAENIAGLYADTFRNCVNLKSVTNGQKLRFIWDYAFSGCTGLTSVNFPAVETIGKQAFYKCSKLASCVVSKTCNVAGNAFEGAGCQPSKTGN